MLLAVQDLEAQEFRVVFGIVHRLRAFVPILLETEDGSARLDEAPDVRIVARFDANPFDEVRFRGINFDGVVERRLAADFDDNL